MEKGDKEGLINANNMKMKNIITLITIFLLSISLGLAQDLRKGGSSFGRVESDGAIRIKGSIKGKIESNGSIRVSGSIKGRIESNGSIRKNGSIVGRVESNGDVRKSGSIVGRIESNGDIRKRGSIVGSARGVDKEYAAVIYFFDFFEIP